MKLVLVAQDFPPNRGAIQNYCWELAKRWSARSTGFRVIAPNVPGCEDFDAKYDVDVRRVSASGDTFFAAAATQLARMAPDTVSFHSQWPSAGSAQLLRAAGRTGKVYVAAHGRELLLRPWQTSRVAQSAYDAARTKALVNADGVFPVSRYTAGLARRIGVELHNLHVEPNGTDPDRFSPGSGAPLREEVGLSQATVYLSVARLLPHKGVDMVLRAFAEVSPALPEAQLVIVGDGPEYERLTALARDLGLERRVLFTGSVNDERLVEWYRAADVFVLPARSEPPTVEGFGTVYLEASACGLPVIGPDEGGPVDAIIEGRTGVRVPPRDLDALIAAMGRLGRDRQLRRALGREGRRHVVEEANWDRVADRLWMTMQVLEQQGNGAQAPPQ